MKDKVYSSKDVAAYHNSFVWAHLNVDLAATRKVMPNFGVRGVPFIAIVTPKGKVVEARTGLVKSPEMVSLIKRGLAKSGK